MNYSLTRGIYGNELENSKTNGGNFLSKVSCHRRTIYCRRSTVLCDIERLKPLYTFLSPFCSSLDHRLCKDIKNSDFHEWLILSIAENLISRECNKKFRRFGDFLEDRWAIIYSQRAETTKFSRGLIIKTSRRLIQITNAKLNADCEAKVQALCLLGINDYQNCILMTSILRWNLNSNNMENYENYLKVYSNFPT